MVKTIEIYYESAYTDKFTATVLSCEEGKDGNFFVILDKTAFFPEQGGQSSDIGILKGADGRSVKVIHTSIKNGIITHVTDGSFNEKELVTGEIDWNHRFSNMQQHTGEHIFSGLVNSIYGYDNVGFHLSDSEVTMDYSGFLGPEQLKDIELKVNRAIWENVEVNCRFPSKEELETIDYRSKKELTGNVRIVTVPGYDVCACCAPHVSRTGEIGLLKVVSSQAYKGGVRVSILCGKRALLFLETQHEILSELSKKLTTSSDKVIASVDKVSLENRELKGRILEMQERLMEYELASKDPNAEDVFLVKEAGMDGNFMRKTVNGLAKVHDGYCGIFSGTDSSGYKYIVASGKKQKDAALIQKCLGQEFEARGGGNAAMIQGSMGSVAISDVIKSLENLEGDK